MRPPLHRHEEIDIGYSIYNLVQLRRRLHRCLGSDAGLIVDANGNLFGTTEQGGVNNYGTVFENP
jgi:hypothetical protein